jgi:hypothetical protein
MNVKTYDFQAFCRGELIRTNKKSIKNIGVVTGVCAVASTIPRIAYAAQPSIDHAFDPIISMLQQLAFPVATICIAWACLEAMIGKPASAVTRAKWAVLGYLAMRYAPDLLRHV